MRSFFQTMLGQEDQQKAWQKLIGEGRALIKEIDRFQIRPLDLALFQHFSSRGRALDSDEKTLVNLYKHDSVKRLAELNNFTIDIMGDCIYNIATTYIKTFVFSKEQSDNIRQKMLDMIKLRHDFEKKVLAAIACDPPVFGNEEELAPLKQAFEQYLDFFEKHLLLETDPSKEHLVSLPI